MLKYIMYLPVAQLDRATDSDSVGRRFESYRAGQTTGRSALSLLPVVCLSQRKPIARKERCRFAFEPQSVASLLSSGKAKNLPFASKQEYPIA